MSPCRPIPNGLQAQTNMSKTGLGISGLTSTALDTSLFNAGEIYVERLSSSLNGGSDYSFGAVIRNKNGKVVTNATTGNFTLSPGTYISNCPAASTTPLVTTTFP
jgi:hypothetical protein